MHTEIPNAEYAITKKVNAHGTITGFKKFRNRTVVVAVLEQKEGEPVRAEEEVFEEDVNG